VEVYLHAFFDLGATGGRVVSLTPRPLYTLQKYFRVMKSRRMRWKVHVARMGKLRNAYKILVGKPKGMNYSEDLVVDGRTILELSLGK
jgi:hypothetical protein